MITCDKCKQQLHENFGQGAEGETYRNRLRLETSHGLVDADLCGVCNSAFHRILAQHIEPIRGLEKKAYADAWKEFDASVRLAKEL